MQAAQDMGYEVKIGNVLYFNRDNGRRKEGVIPWDAIAKYDAEQFFEAIRKAREDISKGKLPDPTVYSKNICASVCPYRTYCDYGQNYAAGKVRRESKRKPQWVYKKAREQHKEYTKQMIKEGLVQPMLFEIDE
jgi:hypothetical protein